MPGCERIEGLLAESLYEELSGADRERLQEHLAECGACREMAAELRLVVDTIPVGEIRLNTDLLPGIRARLDAVPRRRRAFYFRPAFAAAAALFVIVAGVIVTHNGTVRAPGVSDDETYMPASRVDEIFTRADRLVSEHNFSGAYVELAEVGKYTQNAADLGRARLMQAKLAYDELHWYPEAHDLYDTVRRQHGDLFRADSENVERINVLDEARGPESDYAALHSLDAARRSRSFEQFESLVARFPGTYVASSAATDMARIAADDRPDDRPETVAASLEAAMDRCESPVAIAQLKVEIANALQENDSDRARQFYRDVAQSGVTVLARVARDALERMDVDE